MCSGYEPQALDLLGSFAWRCDVHENRQSNVGEQLHTCMLATYAQTDIDARPTPGEAAVYDSGSEMTVPPYPIM